MNKSVSVCAALAAAAIGSSAFGALSQTLVGPTTQTYNNGGGSGFGGVLGVNPTNSNTGAISMGVSGGNLDVSFAPANSLNDLVVIRFDTRNGGIADTEMDDQADGGRRAASSGFGNGFLNEPFGMNTYTAGSGGGVSDFALVIGGFGSVLFELTAGNNLNFLIFNAAPNMSIPLATLGGPSVVDWFAYYTADSAFLSNESLPASPGYNAGGNFGFGNGTSTAQLENFNRFLVPAPGAAALLGLGGLLVGRRRR